MILIIMVIPNSSTIYLELLKILKDTRVITMKEVVSELSSVFNLNKEEQNKMKKSGNGTIFDSRVNWAKYNLKVAGLVMSPKKGQVKITNTGIELLKKKDLKIDRKFLKNFYN